MDSKKYSLRFVLTLVLLTAALIFGLLLGMYYFTAQGPVASETDDHGINEMLDIIAARYIGAYDEEQLIVDIKRAMVSSLDDNWSYYMTPGEYETYLQSSANTYHGIGIEVLLEDGTEGIKVMNVYIGSGAHAAGIVIGDVITAIDGISIKGYTLVEIRAALRRPLEDTAIVTVLRKDGEYHDIPVVYNVIFQDPVSFQMLEGNIGYVQLRNFEGSSADSFINAVETLIEQGATSFIYDVRSNKGGRLTEMTAILDFLLPEGEIFIAVYRDEEERITVSDGNFIDLPAVVLINAHSYSGAEYFAVTLSEYGYAVTVGEQTTGKNRMQTTLPLSDGGALHISTGKYLTKNRISLFDQGGFAPDYIIAFTEEELAQFYRGELSIDDDPHLQKAIDILVRN